MARSCTVALLSVVAVAALTVAPRAASACSRPLPILPEPPPAPDHTELHWGAAIGVGAALDAGVIITQLVAGREMFPEWAAGTELGLGVAEVALGTALWVTQTGNSCVDSDAQNVRAIASGALFGVGSWLIAHAIWSLADHDAEEESPDVLPALSVSADGAMVAAIGRF
jgi:hypothetical protein